MILAAGLTPAWQQILVFDAFTPGEVNRAREVHWCGSGKVLNVGLALAQLNCRALSSDDQNRSAGGPPVAPSATDNPATTDTDPSIDSMTLAPLGGPAFAAIEAEFAELNVPRRWIGTSAPTRICTTILDSRSGRTTELVENARSLPSADLDAFRQAYAEEAARAEVIVLSGSLPAGTPISFYRDLLSRSPGSTHGAAGPPKVILDARGPELLAALECRPYVVKPNREELGQTVGRPLTSDKELRAAMRELNQRGAEWVVVSQGKSSVWVSSRDVFRQLHPPAVEVVNPIGSGDCLAAGIAAATSRSEDMLAAVRYGMACAALNATQLLPSRLDPREVESWLRKVKAEG